VEVDTRHRGWAPQGEFYIPPMRVAHGWGTRALVCLRDRGCASDLL
jgi:hypothetical protein